jgi:hypothetical protein
MQHRFKARCAPETLSLFAVAALMTAFAAGLFCADDSFRERREKPNCYVVAVRSGRGRSANRGL